MSRSRGRLAVVAAAGLAAAVPAAPAAAAVRISDERVVVTSGGGRAVVERAPFRLSFQDRRGRTVLRQVAPRERRARRLPPTLDPEPFTLEQRPDNAVYAPLAFEVGREDRDQWNGSFWAGNMLRSRRSGTVHAARRVVRAVRAGRGARLLVATTDRTRSLVVRIAPGPQGTLRVRVTPTRAAGVITMGDSFVARRGEGFHGFGGRHGTVNKRGEKLYGWTEQENFGGQPTLSNTGLLPALVEQGTDFTIDQLGGILRVPDVLPGGFERYLVPGGPNGAYYPQNLFYSSRGYGFVLDNPQFSRWRMANDRPDAWQVQASARELAYTVAVGAPRRAIRAVTAIHGRHRLPPAWAQGRIVWRAVAINQPQRETAETYLRKIEQDLADVDRFGVRLSGYAFEGWRLLSDEQTRSVIERLRARGIRAILYVRAYTSDDALATERPEDVAEALREGWVARDARGRPYRYDANGDPGYVWDFTNPRARAGWRARLERMLEAGADGFMQDFGEQVQEDMRFANGETGVTMHNRLPVIYHRLSREIADAWARRTGRSEPIWFFTRSGFTGSARYEMGTFPGDETPDWSAGSGLRSLAPDMLNRAVGGAWGFTTDIGGYADLLTGPPNAELFTRWSEWSALTPYFRVHNSPTFGTRMPWSYGPEVLARWTALADLHDRAVPYVRRLWNEGSRTGMPPTRPMWLAAPEAPGAATEAQQWLLGDDVLVAPVVVEGATSRSVSLPRGCWEPQFGDRTRLRGPARVTVQAPLGTLPYFFRCGTRPF
jgi:sulfoquinovosidase